MEPRRVAPWLIALVFAALIASYLVSDRRLWIGPLFILLGAAVGTQGIDALRTDELHGTLPNRWPIRAHRDSEPFTFWTLTTVYLALGGVWFVMGLFGCVQEFWLTH